MQSVFSCQLYITRARLTIGVTDRVLSQDEVCCALMNCLCQASQSPRRSAGLLYRVGFISMLPEVLLFKTSCTFINSWVVCLFVCFPICEQACRPTDQSKLIRIVENSYSLWSFFFAAVTKIAQYVAQNVIVYGMQFSILMF